MKLIWILCTICIFNSSLAGNPEKMMGKKVPQFSGKDTRDSLIDTHFFEGKVTLVTFLYLGCPPCMMEMPVMDSIQHFFKEEKFQILGIAANTSEQIRQFNDPENLRYGKIKDKFKIDSIPFLVMPECDREKPLKKREVYEAECKPISSLFNIDGYPTLFLIDKKGIIRQVYDGYPAENEKEYWDEIKKEIKGLLNQ